ncbi:MAG: FmdB family zinc ribbon protein, partial [Desulfobulbus sp.]
MPVYEYECSGCKKVFEIQQHIADAPLKVCPECGAPVRKLISMSSFQLKGSGWYSDGYSSCSGGVGTAAAAGGPSSSGSDAGGSSCPAG